MNAFENATTSTKELPTARANAILCRSIFFSLLFVQESRCQVIINDSFFLVREHKPNVLIWAMDFFSAFEKLMDKKIILKIC